MNITPSPRLLRTTVVALATLLAAPLTLAQPSPPPAGRLLASNCFQCHGTNGRGPGFEQLAGKSPNEMYDKLREFQLGKEGDGIMARHAMGYTDAQMRALSLWLSTQR